MGRWVVNDADVVKLQFCCTPISSQASLDLQHPIETMLPCPEDS